MEEEQYEVDQKVYAKMGKEQKEGVIVKVIRPNRYLVKVLMSKPTAKTRTITTMRFSGKHLSKRTKGTISI